MPSPAMRHRSVKRFLAQRLTTEPAEENYDECKFFFPFALLQLLVRGVLSIGCESVRGALTKVH
jgi:hypothetical protein